MELICCLWQLSQPLCRHHCSLLSSGISYINPHCIYTCPQASLDTTSLCTEAPFPYTMPQQMSISRVLYTRNSIHGMEIFMTLHFQQYNFLIPYLEEFDEYLRCTTYCLNEQCWTAGRQSAHTSTTKVSFCTIILKRCHGQCWSWYSQNLCLPPWVLKHYFLHYTETLLP